jgi:hypothetical protein
MLKNKKNITVTQIDNVSSEVVDRQQFVSKFFFINSSQSLFFLLPNKVLYCSIKNDTSLKKID